MDITKQMKLTKDEWDSVEIPVSANEMEVYNLIIRSFVTNDVNYTINKTNSILRFLKIEYDPTIEEFLYSKYFSAKVTDLVAKFAIPFIKFENKKKNNGKESDIYYIHVSNIVRLKSKDQIRMASFDSQIDLNSAAIFEFIIYNYLEQMIKSKHKSTGKTGEKSVHWMFYYFTIHKLMQNNIDKINRYVKEIVEVFLAQYEKDVDVAYILRNAVEYIERNCLLKYSDLKLFEHQKAIFTAVKSAQNKPKLILYIAPTGTGKTLTPLGLSQQFKIIFVCAARHVGLAFARSAIAINKKIAVAFGCSSADDVKLHNFAASKYTVNKRSGKIQKIDNSVGDKVEIIICDVRSYLPAMHYILAFTDDPNKIITYWDEPTITMDYPDHPLHSVIHQNWRENMIPNMVLSSATLPKIHEIQQTVVDFQEKFPGAEIINIVSDDCRKSIALINNNGYVVMPHYLYSEYSRILEVVANIEENLSLLRYLDVKETIRFIEYMETASVVHERYKVARYFLSIQDIDLKSIKLHYLRLLKHIEPAAWPSVYNYFQEIRDKRIPSNNNALNNGQQLHRLNSVSPNQSQPIQPIKVTQEKPGTSGIYVTTKDAYTLTDGPTIFITKDVEIIVKFCIQQANIPASVMDDIMSKIEHNNKINADILKIEKEIEYEESKMANEGETCEKEDRKLLKLRENISMLQTRTKCASLNDVFVPNRMTHLKKWAAQLYTSRAFTSNIDEETIVSIMLLKDVEDCWKISLMLGIGVYMQHKSIAYTEIMKKLGDQQKLYLIIADSDYIHGTNHPFCHGYISKDIPLTQEKIIQSLGRIGRENIQQEYTVRFRDDAQLHILFSRLVGEEKLEVVNMNQFFNSRTVRWNPEAREYDEIVG
jgi:hypothetical protein